MFDKGAGFGAGGGEDVGVAQNVGKFQRRKAGLFGSEELAGAAEFEIHFGDGEAVLRIDEGADAFFAGVVQFFSDEQAVALFAAATDASTELVELGEAEALRLLDDHDGGVGDVDADLDDGGRNEDFGAAAFESFHGGFLFRRAEAAVKETDGDIGKDFAREVFEHLLRGFHSLGFGLFDDGVDDVGLTAGVDLTLDHAVGEFDLIGGEVLRQNLFAAGGKFVDGGNVEVAVDGHGEGAGDGGCGHDEDVGGNAFLHEAETLHDAEAMLFVDDDEAEFLEFDILFNEGVGADGDGDLMPARSISLSFDFSRGGVEPVRSATTTPSLWSRGFSEK